MPKVASNGVAKKKKDPNKPKGAKSAYIFFTEYCKDDGDHTKDFSLFSKECGRKWKEMGEDDKVSYYKKAEADKIRRDNEMQDYVPPYDADDQDDGKTKRKKKEKDPNAPKRNLSAYFFYAKLVRPTVVADLNQENKGHKVTEVMKEVAARWNALGEKSRAGDAEAIKKMDECQELAKADQKRYKDESDAYSRKQHQQQQLLQQQRQQQPPPQHHQPYQQPQHQQQHSSTSYQQPQYVDDDEDDEEYEEEYEEWECEHSSGFVFTRLEENLTSQNEVVQPTKTPQQQ